MEGGKERASGRGKKNQKENEKDKKVQGRGKGRRRAPVTFRINIYAWKSPRRAGENKAVCVCVMLLWLQNAKRHAEGGCWIQTEDDEEWSKFLE